MQFTVRERKAGGRGQLPRHAGGGIVGPGRRTGGVPPTAAMAPVGRFVTLYTGCSKIGVTGQSKEKTSKRRGKLEMWLMIL